MSEKLPFDSDDHELAWNPERMYANAKIYAQKIVADLERLPHVCDEVDAYLDLVVIDLECVANRHQHGSLTELSDGTMVESFSLEQEVVMTLRHLDEIIPTLREDYEIMDTRVLEDIQSKLERWLQQRGRGRGPQPAPVP